MRRIPILVLVVGLIALAIGYFQSIKTYEPQTNQSNTLTSHTDRAPEITTPAGFINSEPFELADLFGKKVILVDFWTYSCINCQRTLPYVNAWHEKYKDNGLVIVGIHTPEFDFEKEISNVERAVEKYGVRYPVVLDNDYGTWTAYKNRYWPRKYLIDIEGKIVYDHIGEGAYDETEAKIQELLKGRAQKFGEVTTIEGDMAKPDNVIVASGKARSPEVYFGAFRNELLVSGKSGVEGVQRAKRPSDVLLNQLHLVGDWNIQKEFAENQKAGDGILFKYVAQNVYMVASSKEPVEVVVGQDGRELKTITVGADDLYPLIENAEAGEHELMIFIKKGGLRAFTFTFG